MADDAAQAGSAVDAVESHAADRESRVDTGASTKRARPVSRDALIAVSAVIVVLAALVGWLGFRAYESHEFAATRDLFVQAARQAAVDLSTVDDEHADADAQRILDSATGAFRVSFSRRSRAFVDSVRQSHSKSVGTVLEAGLETQAGDAGQVLVAVAVTSAKSAGPERQPQQWRMRITVQKTGDGAKIAKVDFVS
ncbi:mammalian cell entry protein [Mycobacterium sp.]|uniref:mammalian cell entry protein n=1 Tax=Mycobacterium sp. TaxID=1785 RepID=UPI0031DBD3E3